MYKKTRTKCITKQGRSECIFVCTLLLYTKVSASKVHSYTSTDLVWAPVWERSERKRTCSGIVYVTHNASVIIVSSVFCSGEGKVSVHCFLVRELSKQSALWHPIPVGITWFQAGVTVSTKNKQDTIRNDIKTRGREDLNKVCPLSFLILFSFYLSSMWLDWKSKP